MKNLTKIFMAVAVAMFAFSCVTDATEDLGIKVEGQGVTELTISLEESRTQLGDKVVNEDGTSLYPLYWSEGDAIAVNGVRSYDLKGVAESAVNATFSFGQEIARPYCVVYPAQSGVGEGTVYPVTFAATQPYTAGSFAPQSAPMYGYAAALAEGEEESAVQLQHLTGILRLAVKGNGETLTSVVAKSQVGKIAGPFTVDCSNGALVAQEEASNAVTVTFAEPFVLGSEAKYIYIAVPAGSYGAFAVTLHTATDKMTVKFDSNNKPVLVGAVREFAEFTYGANTADEDSDVFEIDSKETLIEFARLAKENEFFPKTLARVTASIDMSGYDWTPIEGFNGWTFDGGKGSGYAINGLNAPLFGESSSTIMNVDLTNVNIASNGRLVLGSVVCTLAEGGSLTNCSASGAITVSNPDAAIAEDAELYQTFNCGGIVGLSNGDVKACVNKVNITVNQVASSATTVGIHPAIGGVVGYSYRGSVVNCVNGDEAKTTGTIKYLDNQEAMLYVPHIAGIAGLRGNSNTDSDLTGNTNYGAIEFNANAGGLKNIDYQSITIGGIAGFSRGAIENNNNYGSINVAGGTIMHLYTGGVAANVIPVSCSNNHNHNSASITVGESVVFHGITVAGVLAGLNGGTSSADGGGIFSCTNDAPIHIKASTATDVELSAGHYYRIAGVVGYTNRTVKDCENKANGDITLEGNVILTRSDAQSGFNVAGVYAYNSTSGCVPEGNTNRGDINVYTNVSKHSSLTSETPEVNSKGNYLYKLDIGGVVAHTQIAPVGEEKNFGNITIGKADGTAQTITANGIYIGGVIGQRYSRGVGAASKAINSGNITINSGVTLNSFTVGTYIGGCSAYNVTSTTFYNYSNSGNIVVDGVIADKTYIGGVAGLANAALNTASNSGAVTFNGDATLDLNLGGLVGHCTGATLTSCANTGDITLNKRTTAAQPAYIGGLLGQVGNMVVTDCTNNGVMTVAKTVTATFTIYIGGFIGLHAGTITLDNCTNSVKEGVKYGVVVESKPTAAAAGSNPLRIGGFIGVNQTAAITTANSVTNHAGIKVTAHYLDSGGLTIGGIFGVMKASSLGGTVTNTGEIYYEGRCTSGNFGFGGLFGTPAGSMTEAKLINTGDIYVVKGEGITDHIPLSSSSKRCVLGGIIGYNTTALANARFYGNLYVVGWHTGAYKTGNVYSMLGGESMTAFTNCHVGGELIIEQDIQTNIEKDADGTEYVTTIVTNTPGKLTTANYFKYLTGGKEFTVAEAKTMECGLISSIDATPEYGE